MDCFVFDVCSTVSVGKGPSGDIRLFHHQANVMLLKCVSEESNTKTGVDELNAGVGKQAEETEGN